MRRRASSSDDPVRGPIHIVGISWGCADGKIPCGVEPLLSCRACASILNCILWKGSPCEMRTTDTTSNVLGFWEWKVFTAEGFDANSKSGELSRDLGTQASRSLQVFLDVPTSKVICAFETRACAPLFNSRVYPIDSSILRAKDVTVVDNVDIPNTQCS